MINNPKIITLGDRKAMTNTYPDPIEPKPKKNGRCLDDFEGIDIARNDRDTFAVTPFPSPVNSFDGCLKRPEWRLNTQDSTTPYSGSYCLYTSDPSSGLHLRENHIVLPLWSAIAKNNTRTIDFWFRQWWNSEYVNRKIFFLCNTYHGTPDWKLDNGYILNYWTANWELKLRKKVNGVYTTLDTVNNPAGLFANITTYKQMKITIKPNGEISIYYEGTLILQATDTTFDNGTFFGYNDGSGNTHARWFIDELRIY